ncbi:hypothetical protein PMM47T1_13028 [Pseudomonas sp. M47T1]|uniref:hypothetical protein n=1 Tax=unclassified Pseudomonas TaxID=196821 RepID=UPI0002607B2B|nr:hypothetical protein [Pseudomonas sp. M47T1]EIK96216.1 hypothetical protein PMM47T1_13028 [Pseudomonas sp. M47T1]
MKQRILDEIAQHRRDGETVVELHLWSKAAIEAITRSKEYADEAFMGIAVQIQQQDVPGMDYIVIVEG